MNEIELIPRTTLLRTALDVINEAVIAVDNEERIVLFNESSEKIFGFLNAEVVGKHIDILFLGSVQDVLQQSKDVICMGSSVFNDTEQTVEMVGQNKYGSLFLCKLIIKRDIDSQNTIINVILNEVYRVKRENDIKESEIRYRRLFESAKDGILILDAETGLINDVNPFLINLLGYTKEDFISKNIWDIGTFRDIVANKEKFSYLQQNEYVRYDDLPLETINGKRIFVEFVSNVYLVNNEKVIQCNIRDISMRKNAQADILEKDIQYRNLANSGVALIWTMDANKLCNYFNQTWLNFTGRTLKQELGNGWLEGIHIEDLDKCMAVFISAFDKREMFDLEYRLRKADGNYAWIRDLGTPNYNSRNEFTGYIGHCFDISDLKITANELVIARDKAEESDKLKTTFLQNMSHEIRTPLNGIIGFSKLLNSENLNNDDIKEFTSIIITSGYRLIEIVNNILDISKIQTGQISVDIQPILLNDMFSELQSFFQFNASDNKIELYFDNNGNNTIIHTDETKLRQILTNLINNSTKFTHSGKINFGYDVFETHIIFYVKDTGIGIPLENQEKVFERFVQSEQTLSRNYEGAGLGLAICKGLVELLGGRIWLDSTPGKGTTISFTLPYSLETDISELNKVKVHKMNEELSGTVLIVEDDIISSKYLTILLENFGLTSHNVQNGREAIEYIKKLPDIDLVLMDMRMPVMDGMEATRIIKNIRPEIPIIAQSAYSFINEKEKILINGCDDYISKPIEPDKLYKLLEKYLKISSKISA